MSQITIPKNLLEETTKQKTSPRILSNLLYRQLQEGDSIKMGLFNYYHHCMTKIEEQEYTQNTLEMILIYLELVFFLENYSIKYAPLLSIQSTVFMNPGLLEVQKLIDFVMKQKNENPQLDVTYAYIRSEGQKRRNIESARDAVRDNKSKEKGNAEKILKFSLYSQHRKTC